MSEESVNVADGGIPTRSVGTVQAEVDGDLILLSPADFSYFGAAGVGSAVWELVDGERTVQDIVASLIAEYDGEPEVIRADTIEFLDALRAAGLITIE